MGILIEDRQNRHRIDQHEIRKKAEIILDTLGSPDGELSILIVSDEEMEGLNKIYLDRPGPTNVIAFPMREGPFDNVNPNLLGDVVISSDTAAREALNAGMTTEARFDQLLIHGILHLFAFDHEQTSEQAEAMRIKEEQLLELLEGSSQLFNHSTVNVT